MLTRNINKLNLQNANQKRQQCDEVMKQRKRGWAEKQKCCIGGLSKKLYMRLAKLGYQYLHSIFIKR